MFKRSSSSSSSSSSQSDRHGQVMAVRCAKMPAFVAVIALLTMALSSIGPEARAAGQASETDIRNAWALYTQHKYAQSADAFEHLIGSSTPSPRLYYYAALANKSGNRMARARQLCQYVIKNFPTSTEAGYAQRVFAQPGDTATAGSGVSYAAVFDRLQDKTVEQAIETDEGRRALKEALNQYKNGKRPASTTTATGRSGGSTKTGGAFPPDVIARDGAGAISQFDPYSDCAFEASLAAMSMLPRGQQLLSEMIRSQSSGGQNTYVVRFPGDGIDYTLTAQKMESLGIKHRATWTTVIHCAYMLKPGTASMEDCLHSLTGKPAEKIFAANTTEQALASFIGDAVKAQNPAVCQASGDFGTQQQLVERGRCYTITGLDSATGMVTLRYPYGANSRRFRLDTDPDHKKFEQLNDGILRIHISIFPKYFSEVARASI